MTKTLMMVQFGMGSSLRRQDYTEAASRAVRHALWHNSINLAELFEAPKAAMLIDLEIGVAEPEAVDREALAAIFPYGQVSVTVHEGGLDVPRSDGGKPTVIANAAISVSLDVEPAT